MTEFVFGQRLTTRVKLKRGHTNHSNKAWVEVPILEKNVRVIGIRTLSNGNVDYGEGAIYEPTEFFKALLVVEKMSSNPFYIKI